MAREPSEPTMEEEPTITIPEAMRYFVSQKRYFGGLFLCLPFLSTGNYALIAWMPSYLERKFSLDLQHIGVFQSIGFIPAAMVAPLIAAALGRFCERTGEPTMPFRIMLIFVPVVGALIALPLRYSHVWSCSCRCLPCSAISHFATPVDTWEPIPLPHVQL